MRWASKGGRGLVDDIPGGKPLDRVGQQTYVLVLLGFRYFQNTPSRVIVIFVLDSVPTLEQYDIVIALKRMPLSYEPNPTS